MERVAVVIVTHDSESVIGRCLEALKDHEEMLSEIVVVDSGSRSPAYLDAHASRPKVRIIKTENVGFSQANNIGFEHCAKGSDFVAFLNPDTFIREETLQRAVALLVADQTIGCLTGKLLGYDRQQESATGLLDSTGVQRSWYGRWFDRGQGEPDHGQYDSVEEVPAACGAFLFCRKEALQQVALAGRYIFDPDFFLYKEDIELCLRLRAGGWNIVYHPRVEALHCRGWLKTRNKVPYALRLTAARSEVLLYRKHPSGYMLWAVCKYLLVKLLHL